METILEYKGFVIAFDVPKTGVKQVFINDALVCEVKSLRGYSTLEFEYDGDTYEVHAIENFNGYDFDVIVNGNYERKAESQFKQLPNVLFVIAGACVFGLFKALKRNEDALAAWPILAVLVGVALVSGVAGAIIRAKQRL